MQEFIHNRIVIGIILGLGITQILKGIIKIIENPKKIKPYWVHIIWVAYIFLMILDFWWWEFKFNIMHQWNFPLYAFLIFYICVFYIICTMLFPENLTEYPDLKDCYYARRNWFFGLLSLTFVIDIFDTLLKGKEYYLSMGIEYPIMSGIKIILCLLAIKVKKEWYHAALGIFFILYTVSWIVRKYYFQ